MEQGSLVSMATMIEPLPGGVIEPLKDVIPPHRPCLGLWADREFCLSGKTAQLCPFSSASRSAGALALHRHKVCAVARSILHWRGLPSGHEIFDLPDENCWQRMLTFWQQRSLTLESQPALRIFNGNSLNPVPLLSLTMDAWHAKQAPFADCVHDQKSIVCISMFC